jgi:hypothetical protein
MRSVNFNLTKIQNETIMFKITDIFKITLVSLDYIFFFFFIYIHIKCFTGILDLTNDFLHSFENVKRDILVGLIELIATFIKKANECTIH